MPFQSCPLNEAGIDTRYKVFWFRTIVMMIDTRSILPRESVSDLGVSNLLALLPRLGLSLSLESL